MRFKKALPTKIVTCFAMLTFSVFSVAGASNKDMVEEPLFKIQSNQFDSTLLERKHAFSVYLPDGYQHTQKRYPVVYVLDGDFLLSTAINTMKMRASRDQMPESIIVALKTKSGANRLSLAMPVKRNKDDTEITFKNSKPKLYLDFLHKELMPYIENNYRTANYNTLIGMSPTVGPVLTDYLTKQPIFDAHIGLATDLNRYTKQSKLLADEVLTRSQQANSTPLYLSRGQIDLSSNPELKKSFDKLAARFQSVDSVKVDVIPDGEHYGMSLAGINNAFGFVFPTHKVKPNYITLRKEKDFVNQLKDFYKNLNHEYGFTFYPVADGYWMGTSIAGSNRYLLRQKRTQEAVELLNWALKTQPNNLILQYNLTMALEDNGQKEHAIASAKKLIELAQQQAHSSLTYFEQYLAELSK